MSYNNLWIAPTMIGSGQNAGQRANVPSNAIWSIKRLIKDTDDITMVGNGAEKLNQTERAHPQMFVLKIVLLN